jgi:hypothetical protein
MSKTNTAGDSARRAQQKTPFHLKHSQDLRQELPTRSLVVAAPDFVIAQTNTVHTD